jgi:hypothetical protein
VAAKLDSLGLKNRTVPPIMLAPFWKLANTSSSLSLWPSGILAITKEYCSGDSCILKALRNGLWDA